MKPTVRPMLAHATAALLAATPFLHAIEPGGPLQTTAETPHIRVERSREVREPVRLDQTDSSITFADGVELGFSAPVEMRGPKSRASRAVLDFRNVAFAPDAQGRRVATIRGLTVGARGHHVGDVRAARILIGPKTQLDELRFTGDVDFGLWNHVHARIGLDQGADDWHLPNGLDLTFGGRARPVGLKLAVPQADFNPASAQFNAGQGGWLTAYLNGLDVGYAGVWGERKTDRRVGAAEGSLLLGDMEGIREFVCDGAIRVGVSTLTENHRGTQGRLSLPPGRAVTRELIVGSPEGVPGQGVVRLNGTRLEVFEALDVDATGEVTVRIGPDGGGLVLSKFAKVRVDGVITLDFSAAPVVDPRSGLVWDRDDDTTVEGLKKALGAGRIRIVGVPVDRNHGVHKYEGQVYVGPEPVPARMPARPVAEAFAVGAFVKELNPDWVPIVPGSGYMLNLYHYPSYNLLRVRLDPGKMLRPLDASVARTPDGRPGVHADYFQNRTLEGEPASRMTLSSLDMGDQGMPMTPNGEIQPNNFSSRYSAVIGPFPHPVQLRVLATDGVRMWIDDELAIDDWRGVWPPRELTADVVLDVGKTYRMRVENFTVGHMILRVGYVVPAELLFTRNQARLELFGPSGEKVLDKPLSWQGGVLEEVYELPNLPEGDTLATATFPGLPRPALARIKRKVFAWEGNTLGITDEVLPPFEPITVDGDRITCVLREFTVGDLGLWASVRAAGNVSAGGPAELLAGPISLVANGTDRLQGHGRFVKTTPQVARYEAKGSHPAVTVHATTTTEIDGTQRVDIQLLPSEARQELRSLWLDVPLRDEMAPLFHVTTAGLRHNPAGDTPPGEGVVWDSTVKFHDGRGVFGTPGAGLETGFRTHFYPYYWFGAEERGLAWFADNDRGWVLDMDGGKHRVAGQQIIRKDGVLTLRVRLVQRPVVIDTPCTITFGFTATPVKPMPTDWRRTTFHEPVPQYKTLGFIGSEYWGADHPFACKYPRHGDLSVLDMIKASRTEPGGWKLHQTFIPAWAERNLRPDQPLYAKSAEQLKTLLKVTNEHLARMRANTPATVYWEEFVQTFSGHEEYDTFGSEWDGGIARAMTGGIVPSYQDFAVWYGKQFIEHGVGLYFDNAFPEKAFDPITTAAYRLPDGRLQPSAGMWHRRDYLRRIWTLHQQIKIPGAPGLMMIHMTNTHLAPNMGWNEANLDLEYWHSTEPQQKRWHHAMLRAQSIGRQTGNIPTALADIDARHGGAEAAQFARRSRFGILAVHEIKGRLFEAHFGGPFKHLQAFGYGEPDCDVYNYWDKGYPLETSNPDVKSLLLERNGNVMIVLCTWNSEPETVTLRLDTADLDISPTHARNAETKEPVTFDGETINLDLEGYGVRILRLE